MKIRFIRSFANYARGQTLDDAADGWANALIDRGIAERVTAKAVSAPPKNKSVQKAGTRRKRKKVTHGG